MDPNEEHDDLEPNLDDFAVVPHIEQNDQDAEVPDDEPPPPNADYDGDDENGAEEEDPEEEADDAGDMEEDVENPDDDFWVAHAEEEDLAGDDWFNWQALLPVHPAPASFLDLVPPEDWNAGAVPLEDDEPIVFQLYPEGKVEADPLKRKDLALAKMIEERDYLLKQRETNWDQIAELQVTIAKLQQQRQEAEQRREEAMSQVYTAVYLKNEQRKATERVQLSLDQTRCLLADEKAQREQVQKHAAMTDKAVDLLCIRIDQEMSLANREKDLTDEEFQWYVHTLNEQRLARKLRQEEVGEGPSHRAT